MWTIVCTRSVLVVGGVESWRLQGRALASLDAVLESVVVFRLAAGAMAEVVIPFGLAEAGTIYYIYINIMLYRIYCNIYRDTEARFHEAEWDNYLRHSPRGQAEYHHGFEHCI